MDDTGLEGKSPSDSIVKTYAKHSVVSDAGSDVNADAPILTSSKLAISADLVVVIEAWPFLGDEAKKKVLAIVWQEHMSS